MTDFTNNGEAQVAAALAGAPSVLQITHLTLHTEDPTETGDVGELSGGPYARKAVALAATGSVVNLAADAAFQASEHPGGGTVTITHATVRTAAAGAGNSVMKLRMEDGAGSALPRDWAEGASFTIAAADFTFTID